MSTSEKETCSGFDTGKVAIERWRLLMGVQPPVYKKLISLRIDADVIDWFKEQGPGYQTRINAVLRAFMEHKEGK